jgi:hypothetical protein
MLGPQNVNTRPNLLGLDAPGTPSEVECLKFELQALEDENDALRKALASRKRMLADLQERYNQLKSGSQA